MLNLFEGNSLDATKEILSMYKDKKFCTVNFLYFANAMKWRLFERDLGDNPERSLAYKNALSTGSFILPDGIALQLFSRFSGVKLQNLNGTDFIPKLIRGCTQAGDVSVYFYQSYDPGKGKTADYLSRGVSALQNNFDITIPRSSQTLYSARGESFDRDGLKSAVKLDTSQIKIFLNCTGTPFQEVWTHSNEDTLKNLGLMVVNAGGFIDYLTGYEKRAPNFVVKARVLETFWRVATHPKKNFKKFASMFGIIRLLRNKL